MDRVQRTLFGFIMAVAFVGVGVLATPIQAADNWWSVITSVSNASCSLERGGQVRVQWQYVHDYSVHAGMIEEDQTTLNGQPGFGGNIIIAQTASGIDGTQPGQYVWQTAPSFPVVYTDVDRLFDANGGLTSHYSLTIKCDRPGRATVSLTYSKDN